MLDKALDRPELLRKEAERYRRLAQNLADQDRKTVIAYCSELLSRAERLEATLKATR